MSPEAREDDKGTHSFPRVSGDEPPTGLIDWWEEVFSPRERG